MGPVKPSWAAMSFRGDVRGSSSSAVYSPGICPAGPGEQGEGELGAAALCTAPVCGGPALTT